MTFEQADAFALKSLLNRLRLHLDQGGVVEITRPGKHAIEVNHPDDLDIHDKTLVRRHKAGWQGVFAYRRGETSPAFAGVSIHRR